ncbi:MAG TPA: hypothetical protein DDY20_02195 [Desulfobulbaceae bacterium]|nr:hypothetical protein [Desulfobulbaceae bacterium]
MNGWRAFLRDEEYMHFAIVMRIQQSAAVEEFFAAPSFCSNNGIHQNRRQNDPDERVLGEG